MEKKELKALLGQMTMSEKLGQMTQTTGEHFVSDNFSDELVVTGPTMENLGLNKEKIYTVGSVLGVSGAKVINKIQKNYLENSRLGIPLLFMHDAIHGYRTIFPIPLALASSFDRKMVEKVGQLTAEELRATGIHVDFSPMVDLVRDARWGRVMESFGEDALLSGRLGQAMIEGYQGSSDRSLSENSVLACLKHFVAYGAPESGRDYASVDMSMKEFFGFYAKTYELALKSHPRMLMASFNSLNGEPVTASKWLLNDILRKRFGFQDLVISDWGAVAELKNHGLADSDKEAGTQALSAGIDIEMVSSSFLKYGEEILTENPQLLEQVNQATWKILQLKNELGLFEAPFVDEKREKEVIRSEKIIQADRAIARKSCVLLKNERQVLPILADEPLIIVGPFAKTQELLGNWDCKGEFSETISVEQAFKGISKDVFVYEKLKEVPCELFKSVKKVIVTLGESWELSGEGHSSSNLELTEKQIDLVKMIKARGKKVIGLGFAGRPLALESVIEDLDALLWTWYLGNEAGNAITDLVFGLDTPTGRLPMSFPRVSAQVPLRYNELRSGRPASESNYSSRYQDIEIGPLFNFGFGLRYGKIKRKAVKLSTENLSLSSGNSVQLSFQLTNESQYDTEETVILFMEDVVSKMVRPVRELLDFQRIALKKGETKVVNFEFGTEQLSYITNQGEQALETGEIRFYINDLTEEVGNIMIVE